MLDLFHYGEVYATGMAKDLGVALSPVQRQLEKFEAAGLLISKMVGCVDGVSAHSPRRGEGRAHHMLLLRHG